MVVFGRETQAKQERVERFRAWVSARSPFAVISFMLGLVAVVDFFTLILGVVFGVAAIGCAVKGFRELKDQPQLLGRRLCIAGITMGVLGVLLSLLMWLVVYPALARS